MNNEVFNQILSMKRMVCKKQVPIENLRLKEQNGGIRPTTIAM